jgi:hypothetical protein
MDMIKIKNEMLSKVYYIYICKIIIPYGNSVDDYLLMLLLSAAVGAAKVEAMMAATSTNSSSRQI